MTGRQNDRAHGDRCTDDHRLTRHRAIEFTSGQHAAAARKPGAPFADQPIDFKVEVFVAIVSQQLNRRDERLPQQRAAGVDDVALRCGDSQPKRIQHDSAEQKQRARQPNKSPDLAQHWFILISRLRKLYVIEGGLRYNLKVVHRFRDSTTTPTGGRMFDQTKLNEIAQARDKWEETTFHTSIGKLPERADEFITASSEPVARLYTPLDIPDFDYTADLGFPGEAPFTRGVHPTMYRSRLWTMRMFAGFGSAEETNARFKYLLEHGQTGLSIAFDLPTLYGYDTDAPESAGEFGKCGVAVSSLKDMEVLLDGIPTDQITTSMTINSPAAIIWAMYIAAAEKQGVPMSKLGGTIQNDILKEYIAQKEFIFPPAPSMRLVTDTIEFGAQHLPKWNPISISGYHIREAGSTAAQELAFTLADGLEYVRWGLQRGLNIDDFAPRLSFFFNAHNDFFEEIAKYRAARRIWAREMKETFGAQESALMDLALPHADGGRDPHRATARSQHRARGDSGVGRRDGRHAKPAHQQYG